MLQNCAPCATAIENCVSGFGVLLRPEQATHCYASIRFALERSGRPFGGMDLLIAAHALAEDSVLITNNAAEFHRVPGLAVEEWRLDRVISTSQR
jgi:tRNA(fMet)-specific endonuclease VapC